MPSTDSQPLKGKTALVTGASRGLGRAIAIDLARRGADVGVHYFRNRRAAQEVCDEIQALGGRAAAFRCHFGRIDQIDNLFAELDAFSNRLDVLVANAASTVFCSASDATPQAWEWTMNVSAHAPLRCAQLAAPRMEAVGGGRIINVSSLGSQRTLNWYAMVGAAKGALETLTRYLAVELAPKGIIVNAVAPGAIGDPSDGESRWEGYPERVAAEKVQLLSRMLERTPLGRLTSPEDVANLVGWLASDATKALVGQTIVLDGGYSVNC